MNKNMYRFTVDDKVKTIVSIQDKKRYHEQRKGSIGIVLRTGVSLGKPCYWIKFGDKYKEWYDEDELNSL